MSVKTGEFYGYKVFYNRETLKYECENEKTLVGSKYEPTTNWFNSFNVAKEVVRKCNEQLELGTRKVIICTDCGTIFDMDYNEIEWYRDRGFVLPKRCSNCRAQRHR